MGFYSDLDLILTESIEKNRKIGKKFLAIFGPLGVPQPTPRSRLRGNLSKIASVAQNLVPRGPTMQNLGSLACSVWAVGGGGGSKMLLHILYSEETCMFVSKFFKQHNRGCPINKLASQPRPE